MVVGMNHIITVIFDNNVIGPLYSSNFIPFSILINFFFNACITAYFYFYTTYGLENKEQDEKLVLTNIYQKHILGRYGNQEFLLDLNKVSYIHVVDKVVLVYYSENEVYSINKSLKHVQSTLDPERFMQINRSYIVCRDAISRYNRRNDDGLNVVLLFNGKEIPVSVSAHMAQASINWISGKGNMGQGETWYRHFIPCL